MTDKERIEILQDSLRAAKELLQRKIDKHFKALELQPNNKYILVVSSDSGWKPAQIAELKLPDNFAVTTLLVNGNIDEVIKLLKNTEGINK